MQLCVGILRKLEIPKSYIAIFPNPWKAFIMAYSVVNGGSMIYLRNIDIDKNGVVRHMAKSGDSVAGIHFLLIIVVYLVLM